MEKDLRSQFDRKAMQAANLNAYRKQMADMRIGVVGAAGRMGGAVIRQVAEIAGCAVVAASEIPASPAVGRDLLSRIDLILI